MHYKKQIANQFLKDSGRTREMHQLLVVHGASRFNPANPTALYHMALPLRNVDRRDLTAFLFLEVAAKFEGFCFQAFATEVRRWYGVRSERAEYVMGSSDGGVGRVFGWADPARLHERGRNLFPMDRFFGNFKSRIGQANYDRLLQAKRIRNRVAHDPVIAREPVKKLTQALNVPSNGMTMGRMLSDYPAGAAPGQRYFFLYLDAFEHCAQQFRAF